MNPSNQGYTTPADFGVAEIIAPADPALAAEWTTTVPTNTIWQVLGIRSTFATDINVASRLYTIEITDTLDIMIVGSPNLIQATSLTRNYNFHHSNTHPLTLAEVSGSINQNLILLAGWTIRSKTTNIQPGDAHTAIRLYIRRWLSQ